MLRKRRTIRIKPKNIREKVRITPKQPTTVIPVADYEKLAQLKVKAKKLDEEIKGLQEEIILGGGVKEFVTTIGKLKLNVREQWVTVDKEAVLDEMGSTNFLQQCTISKSKIVEILGKKGFQELADLGVCKISSVSRFYKLSK